MLSRSILTVSVQGGNIEAAFLLPPWPRPKQRGHPAMVLFSFSFQSVKKAKGAHYACCNTHHWHPQALRSSLRRLTAFRVQKQFAPSVANKCHFLLVVITVYKSASSDGDRKAGLVVKRQYVAEGLNICGKKGRVFHLFLICFVLFYFVGLGIEYKAFGLSCTLGPFYFKIRSCYAAKAGLELAVSCLSFLIAGITDVCHLPS